MCMCACVGVGGLGVISGGVGTMIRDGVIFQVHIKAKP